MSRYQQYSLDVVHSVPVESEAIRPVRPVYQQLYILSYAVSKTIENSLGRIVKTDHTLKILILILFWRPEYGWIHPLPLRTKPFLYYHALLLWFSKLHAIWPNLDLFLIQNQLSVYFFHNFAKLTVHWKLNTGGYRLPGLDLLGNFTLSPPLEGKRLLKSRTQSGYGLWN